MKTDFKVGQPCYGTGRRPLTDLLLQFSNLLGTVYRKGNLCFTPDGTCLLSPVGNRVTYFDLAKYEERV
jgi:periodic tryptophan protein 2